MSPSGCFTGLAFIPLSMLLSGCVVGPNYSKVKVNAPAVFRGAEATAQQASIADLPWWDVFKDADLKGLIQTSLANNHDLAGVVTRVEQARQVAAEARSQYFPAISYNSVISAGQNQFTTSPASNGNGVQGFFLGIALATWEPDLWGRIRRMNESAMAQYLATEEGRRGVMLTLVSDVSQAYFELLELKLQLDIARASAGSYGDSLTLFTQRLEGGIVSKLATSRAAAAEATAAANIPEVERLIALKENQISILLGNNPGAIEVKEKLLDETIPPEVPSGLPSALLERRPDVLAAEQNVRAANAQIGVATAAFFPTLGLTTFLGKVSSPLSEITAGSTNAWSVGANLAGPIYQGGALRAKKKQAIASWEQAREQYLQTSLNAFRDVSDALVSREKYDLIRVEQARAVRAGEESVELSLTRFREGLSSYYEVLEAQQQLFPAQSALAQTELNRRLVIVQLYKALGGGWNLTDAELMAGQALPGAVPSPAGKKP
jgi:outer membrane protein, multidrug efflux system